MNKFSVFVFCLITFETLSASALADVDKCLDIQASMDRLACYDREAGYNPVIRTVEGTGKWKVHTETSKIDDSTNVYLFLESDNHENCPYDQDPHQISMACRENTTNFWVTFGGCFMSSHGGKGRVTYRIDLEEARQINFRESNDNNALGLWSGGRAIPFIKKILGHDKLLIRAQPFSESTVTGEYPIAGIDEAIKPLREACAW